MRGPKHMQDVLRDLHRGAFPDGASPAIDSTRIEIVSNASDSDVSELRDDPLNERGLGGRPSRRPRRNN
jgi:hypothetical protein